ncbi:acyltransferase [Mesorhizobium sp. M0018]|uniref:acyltransferase family protein n=1 Tax=Mesorhizobium sp. M0018 TaxID=2956844 RepID=UPI003337EC32
MQPANVVGKFVGLIRFLLALSVLCSHAGGLPIVGSLAGGRTAVEAFFVLSGFYMSLVLVNKYDSAIPFYIARLSKIYSGYWIALAFAFIVMLAAGRNIFSEIIASEWTVLSKGFMFVTNIGIVGSDIMMFSYPGSKGMEFTANFHNQSPKFFEFHYIAQAWSLPLELMFYLIAPFLVRSVKAMSILCALSLAARVVIFLYVGNQDPWSYRFFPAELSVFLMGSISYQVHRAFRPENSKAIGRIMWITLIFAIFLCGAVDVPGKGIPIILLVVLFVPFIFDATKDMRVDRWLGDISYLVYLVHYVLISAFERVSGHQTSTFYYIIVAVGVAAGLHPLANRFDRGLKEWLSRRMRVPLLPVGKTAITAAEAESRS